MIFIIHALDKEGHVAVRLVCPQGISSQHKHQDPFVWPVLAGLGETMIGSFFMVEPADKAEVIAFNANDPFAKVGLWQSVSIHPFNKRVDNRETSAAA